MHWIHGWTHPSALRSRDDEKNCPLHIAVQSPGLERSKVLPWMRTNSLGWHKTKYRFVREHMGHLPCNVQKWWNIVYLHIREVPVVLDSWPVPLLKHNCIILLLIVSILRNLYIEKAPVHHWGTGPRNGDPRIARLLLEQRCDPDASNMQPADSRVFLFMLFDLRHPKKGFGYWPTVKGIQQNEQINILINKNGNGPNCLRPREAQMDWPF